MFRNKNLATANQIIDSLLDSGQLEKREGAIVLHRKAGRKTISTGTIYLRDGFIYAVNIDTMPTPIARRVATSGVVDKEDFEYVLRTAGSKENNPQIVDLLLEMQLVSNKVIDSFVKEHFIAQISEILTWETVLGEWHTNVTTKAFVMPYVSFAKIREVISKRIALRNEFDHLTARFFRSDEVPLLTFTLTQKNLGDKNQETIAVSKFCNNQTNIGEIAQATGLTEYNVFQIILVLWKEGLLTIHLGGIQVPYSSAQAAQNLSLGKNIDEVIAPSAPPIHIPGTEPEEEEPEEEEPAVIFEEVPDEEPVKESLEEFAIQKAEEVDDEEFNEQLNDIFAQDFPTPVIDPTLAQISHETEETNDDIAEEVTEVHYEPETTIPSSPFGIDVAPITVAAPIHETPEEENKEIEPAIPSQPEVQEDDTVHEEENIASEPSEEQDNSGEEHAPEELVVEGEEEDDDEFAQLTRELEKLQAEFSDTVDVLNDVETKRDNLLTKKEELENQLNDLNKQITQVDKEFDKAQNAYNEAYDRVQNAVNNFTFPAAGES